MYMYLDVHAFRRHVCAFFSGFFVLDFVLVCFRRRATQKTKTRFIQRHICCLSFSSVLWVLMSNSLVWLPLLPSTTAHVVVAGPEGVMGCKN